MVQCCSPTGPNHPRKRTSLPLERSGPSIGLRASTTDSHLSRSTAASRSPPHPSSSQPSHRRQGHVEPPQGYPSRRHRLPNLPSDRGDTYTVGPRGKTLTVRAMALPLRVPCRGDKGYAGGAPPARLHMSRFVSDVLSLLTVTDSMVSSCFSSRGATQWTVE